MKKQLLKFSFVALSLLVLGVNAYAQFTNKKMLKLEGTRQIIAVAKRCAGTNGALDEAIPVADEGGNVVAFEHFDPTFSAVVATSVEIGSESRQNKYEFNYRISYHAERHRESDYAARSNISRAF